MVNHRNTSNTSKYLSYARALPHCARLFKTVLNDWYTDKIKIQLYNDTEQKSFQTRHEWTQ